MGCVNGGVEAGDAHQPDGAGDRDDMRAGFGQGERGARPMPREAPVTRAIRPERGLFNFDHAREGKV